MKDKQNRTFMIVSSPSGEKHQWIKDYFMRNVNQGSNIYCGPAVLSILTGKSTDECARVINDIRGKAHYHEVKEIHTASELPSALNKLGFDIDVVDVSEGSSLFWMIHFISGVAGMYVVQVPKHVVAVEVKDNKVYLCDNHTKEPISIGNSSRLGQTVTKVWSVRERPKPVMYSYTIRKLTSYVTEMIVESPIQDLTIKEVKITDNINILSSKTRYNDDEYEIMENQ